MSDSNTQVKKIKRWSAITGLVAFVLFLLTPLLPVTQTQSSLQWPQDDDAHSVTAPLMSYTSQSLEATIPVAQLDSLREGESLVFGTLPPDSENAFSRGLFVRSVDGGLSVIVREKVLLELKADELPKDATLRLQSTEKETTATINGKTYRSDSEEEEEDLRPVFTGVYSELTQAHADTLVDVQIDSRYTSSPTVLKMAAMVLGIIFTIISLWLLARLDPPHNFRPLGSLKLRKLDGIVAGFLGFWYVFGANTSDDGFILTMARVSQEASYMANYYRWFGVPESPFGAPYYDLLGLMSQVSTSSVWMRLPSLLSGLIIWFVLSREVLPRLGAGIGSRKVAHWTAAFMFLAFWMAYNNGLRPEPIIAAGSLLAWVSFERAIATRTLLPAAFGTAIAAFTLACGPTGLMAVSALLASTASLLRIMYQRNQGWLPLVAPFLAAGTSVLIAVFGDQTLRTVLESIHVRGVKGPSLSWFNEPVRYEILMQQTVDGSFARRFAVLFAFACIAIVVASMLRHGKVPGSNQGPAFRLLLMMLGTLFFMMFTPTKWTHHFGVWAGIAAALAALAAVAISGLAFRSARARTLLLGATLFLFAFVLSGTNGWWYVSSYGIPWFDKTIQYRGFEASGLMLAISLVVLAIGVLQSLRAEVKGETTTTRRSRTLINRLLAAPITLVCVLAVCFYSLSFAKAFASQYPAYSVGLGNLRSFSGNTCGLANDVLVETNTTDAHLQPVNSSLGESMEADEVRGFTANNVPTIITTDFTASTATTAMSDAVSDSEGESMTEDAGRRGTKGVNGSNAGLPFNLDYTKVPVLGSWSAGEQHYAEVTTDWYHLPEQRSEDQPLIVVSAAGRIKHDDINGVRQHGQELMLEYGVLSEGGKVKTLGEAMFADIGPNPTWRNLRLPLDDLPEEANVVRIHATDASLDPDQWIAFTPPRVPELASLNDVVGSDTPVLLDWSTPLQFPCQRPFNHYAGVAEVPEYRISPDSGGKQTGSPFQDYKGGGVLGPAEAVNSSYQLPSYLAQDWRRDWGSIEVLRQRTNSQGEQPREAEIHTEEMTRSGLWNPGRMNITTD